MADARTLANSVTTRAQTAPDFLAYRGFPKATPGKGYAVLLFGAGTPQSPNVAQSVTDLRWSFRAICVGFTDDQCLFVAARFRARFNHWRPTSDRADGWLSEAPDDAPLILDTSVEGDPRYSITLRYILTTRST